MCPRCKVLYCMTETGPKKVNGENGAMLINMVEEFIVNLLDSAQKKIPKPKRRGTTTVILPPVPAPRARIQECAPPVTNCERCGNIIPDSCGVICPNCKHMKSCTIG